MVLSIKEISWPLSLGLNGVLQFREATAGRLAMRSGFRSPSAPLSQDPRRLSPSSTLFGARDRVPISPRSRSAAVGWCWPLTGLGFVKTRQSAILLGSRVNCSNRRAGTHVTHRYSAPQKSLSVAILSSNVEIQDPPATITVDLTLASVTSASRSVALVSLDRPGAWLGRARQRAHVAESQGQHLRQRAELNVFLQGLGPNVASLTESQAKNRHGRRAVLDLDAPRAETMLQTVRFESVGSGDCTLPVLHPTPWLPGPPRETCNGGMMHGGHSS